MVDGPCACGMGWYSKGTCTVRCRRPIGPGHRNHPDHDIARRRRRSRSRHRRARVFMPSPSPLRQTREDPPDYCCVCLERRVDCRLQPCRHAATCIRCAAIIFATSVLPPLSAIANGGVTTTPCPLCRAASTHWLPFP